MNTFLATCLRIVIVLMVLLAWSVVWAGIVIWAINTLGGSLEFNWQTVVAIVFLTLAFAPRRKRGNK